ncbi:uncharacterized protein LOC141910895 [Tubulanus polymorphus]|uniref:uncharacterized protein LOC141910895 n=1 Tax=Tubulanus polymorphus TaxID=672921 RepID=UPI003DA2C83F
MTHGLDVEEQTPRMEDSKLYHMINVGTKDAFREAWRLVGRMSEDELRLTTTNEGHSYMHLVIYSTQHLYDQNKRDLSPSIVLLYRLALRGCDINAQNNHGNTCLHLATFRPWADLLCQHLIRLGADCGLRNTNNCRIIHSFREHSCHMVKNQDKAKSGIWSAIEGENKDLVESYLRCWVRVNVRRRKLTLRGSADRTGNDDLLQMLDKAKNTNELVVAALACDVQKVKELLNLKSNKPDLSTCDESYRIPKPLIAAVKEMGTPATDVIRILLEQGAPDDKEYQAKIKSLEDEFEESEFYALIDEGTVDSLDAALQTLEGGTVYVNCRSNKEETHGSTYLHLIVNKYKQETDVKIRRLLIRLVYRLALDGIDVNARDNNGETVAITSFDETDHSLLDHLIKIGVDTSKITPAGRGITIETYDFKGRLILSKDPRRTDMPGLWPAVEDNDIARTKRWLQSWCRVNTIQSGRKLRDVAVAMGHTEIAKLLEEFNHVNEFVCAVFACDMKRMKNLLALGKGKWKVNIADEFFHAGFKVDRSSEYVRRPLVLSAMEICTAQVVEYLQKFGADLTIQYEEVAPCGPCAFWAFRDDIENSVTNVVSKHADLDLRDERGATMLHKAVKKRDDLKEESVKILLERGINVAARDIDGLTARDYCTTGLIPESEGSHLAQVIDDYVLYCCATGEHDIVEHLILDSYDHILDINGTAKRKTAKELAYLKEQKDMLELLNEIPAYEKLIGDLHNACQNGDLKTLTKLSQEKKGAWGRDLGGRNILHKAVIFGQTEVVCCLIEQYPDLIKGKDNLLRTPEHFAACLGDQRRMLNLLWSEGTKDLGLSEANNLSVQDYLQEMDQETLTRAKPRGRRHYDYKVKSVLEIERNKKYGIVQLNDDE